MPVTTNDAKKEKLDYIGMATQKFKLCLNEHISDVKFDLSFHHNIEIKSKMLYYYTFYQGEGHQENVWLLLFNGKGDF